MCEPSKPTSVQIYSQWIVTCAQDVYTHIEFSTSQEQRVEDIPLTDVAFNGLPVGSLPATDVTDFVKYEYAFPLALGSLVYRSSTGFMIHSNLSLC